ncbi:MULTISPECIES: hypothetical protein [Mycolicibacterium]|uniref:ESX-1 secretion-associated protein EspH n=1 Tax=Mycolicibacterium senegalense TaxID=1796 RepID=A0A378W5V1_9MYCO|nr:MULTISPECIES: hypothetical protein [Mycolicibacterium]MCV7333740.1 hypothetical protein [Mycolicibacterium senegalense]MDR7288216.1 hypothetical protein [Mycolicibacterium senegalense]QZA25184.1 hypothetical protein K3U95_03510 [Mycolicibacterium senegalense]CDP85921.1 ESX-1 secretion-associated protein EspH [Mycolicibacterium farcinogenes]SUA28209.1 ESX-1 secretion-associated protein EspH [Mycolicibacterium senegalense]
MTTHDPDDEFFYSEDTGLDALDFDTPIQPDDDGSGLDALPDYSIGEIDQRTNLDGVDDFTNAEVEEDEDDGFGPVDADAATADEDQGPVVQAINPPGTVAVTAYLGGSVAHVDLDPKVTALTESQLAEEIRFVAGVATKKAAAVVHVGVVNMFVEQGMNLRDARDFVETNMPFATPEQAHEADLALIARHSERED